MLVGPYPHSFVLSSTAHSLSVWTPVNGEDFVFMTRQVHGEFACADIPDLQRGVL